MKSYDVSYRLAVLVGKVDGKPFIYACNDPEHEKEIESNPLFVGWVTGRLSPVLHFEDKKS